MWRGLNFFSGEITHGLRSVRVVAGACDYEITRKLPTLIQHATQLQICDLTCLFLNLSGPFLVPRVVSP